MSTLLGPAVVLVAIVATLRLALVQPDQTATTKTLSRRGSRSGGVPRPVPSSPVRDAGPRARSSSPVIVAAPAPAGFQWMDATPAPRMRSGFALVVVLTFLGALLAMAVAGLAAAVAVVVQSL